VELTRLCQEGILLRGEHPCPSVTFVASYPRLESVSAFGFVARSQTETLFSLKIGCSVEVVLKQVRVARTALLLGPIFVALAAVSDMARMRFLRMVRNGFNRVFACLGALWICLMNCAWMWRAPSSHTETTIGTRSSTVKFSAIHPSIIRPLSSRARILTGRGYVPSLCL
jgi:hypothetical protein